MKYFERFSRSGCSFEERDDPSAICSAVGWAALVRAGLEEYVESTLRDLLPGEPSSLFSLDGYTLSQKVELLAGQITSATHRRHFDVGVDLDVYCAELVESIELADRLYLDAVNVDLLTLHLRASGPIRETDTAEPVLADLPALLMDVAEYHLLVLSRVAGFFLPSNLRKKQRKGSGA